jgi:hypothetical protein
MGGASSSRLSARGGGMTNSFNELPRIDVPEIAVV